MLNHARCLRAHVAPARPILQHWSEGVFRTTTDHYCCIRAMLVPQQTCKRYHRYQTGRTRTSYVGASTAVYAKVVLFIVPVEKNNNS